MKHYTIFIKKGSRNGAKRGPMERCNTLVLAPQSTPRHQTRPNVTQDTKNIKKSDPETSKYHGKLPQRAYVSVKKQSNHSPNPNPIPIPNPNPNPNANPIPIANPNPNP